MSGVLYGSLLESTQFQRQVQASLVEELDYILASEVVAAIRDRCANGMQYTTFPNRITDLEKQKLTDAGYIVTENTVHSQYRDGAPDLYIGFQVALNQTATKKAMAIGEVAPADGTSYDYNMLVNKPTINGVTLQGDLTLHDLGIDELTQEQLDELVSKIP